MRAAWDRSDPGMFGLPSGRVVRTRGLRQPVADVRQPEFELYLLGKEPPAVAWSMRWIQWPDFGLPCDRQDAVEALREIWLRAEDQRVEIACSGGHGRTGTALACIAVIGGVPAKHVVALCSYAL